MTISKRDKKNAERVVESFDELLEIPLEKLEGWMANLLAQERERAAKIAEKELASHPWLSVKVADAIRKKLQDKKKPN